MIHYRRQDSARSASGPCDRIQCEHSPPRWPECSGTCHLRTAKDHGGSLNYRLFQAVGRRKEALLYIITVGYLLREQSVHRIVATVAFGNLQPLLPFCLRMPAVMMVDAAVLLSGTMVVMDLVAIVACKHTEQLHRMVIGAFVGFEPGECRQINSQQQRYGDIACKLFHLKIILSQ